MRRITEPALRNLADTISATLSPAEAKLKKPTLRRFSWSRLHSDLLDDFRWSLVAKRVGAPLPLVEAVIIRLEGYANRSYPRGHVGDFSAEGLAARWDVDADLIARIYAALEAPDIGWIDQDQVVSFWDRNPDTNDDTAAERQQRVRERKKCNKQLERMLALGQITEHELQLRKMLLKDSKQPLALMASWTDLSTGRSVTRDDRDALKNENRGFSAELSPGRVTRDNRDVTTRSDLTKIINQEGAAVDNSGDNAGGEAQGFATNNFEAEAAHEATVWVDTVGRKMLVEYLQIQTTLAETYIERWRRDLQDDSVLAEIMKGAESAGYIGARFHTLITDQLKRFIARREHGPSLPLMPPRPQTNLKRTGYG